MIHIGDGRIKDLGASLKHVLDHSPTVHPINGPHHHLVPNQNPPPYLLQHRLHHAQELHSDSRRIARTTPGLEASRRFLGGGAGLDDDAHEVGLGGGDGADGLGLGERGGVVGGEHRAEGGEVLDGLFGSEELLARLLLELLGDAARVLMLLRGGDGEASESSEAAEDAGQGRERGGVDGGSVAEDGNGSDRHGDGRWEID